jgi:hypothetical protein
VRALTCWNRIINVLRTPEKPVSFSRPCQLVRFAESETAKAQPPFGLNGKLS